MNRIILSGIIKSIGDTYYSAFIDRPIIEIISYNKETETWTQPIKLLLTENDEIRKAQGYCVGDIILLFGSLSYSPELGFFVFSNELLILNKNKQKLNISYRKPLLFQYEIQNFAICLGKITNLADVNKICLSVNRDSLIRGELPNNDVLPISVEDSEMFKTSLGLFIGYLNGPNLLGTAYPINL